MTALTVYIPSCTYIFLDFLVWSPVIALVLLFLAFNVNSAGELSMKFNHWRGRDK